MTSLTVIIVGYNEELNIPKLLISLESARNILPMRIIYIDQSSADNSIFLLKYLDIEVIIRENKGYADPDKKWAVENLVGENEYCLLLDADEEITVDLITEISHISEDEGVYTIPLYTYFLGRRNAIAKQLRLFTKSQVTLSDTIHEYIKMKENIYPKELKAVLINIDIKMYGNDIQKSIEKINKYTSLEVREGIGPIFIIIQMICMPVIWFFFWGIRHRNFLEGVPGFIWCGLMAYYQFILYAKQYEKLITKDIGSK